MGFMDKVKQGLKDATGLGLDVQEQFDRAYEKGVFIKDYPAAVKNFAKAAEKAKETGDEATMKHARANAAVYTLFTNREADNVTEAIAALGEMDEIEQLGTNQETVKAGPWADELSALQAEIEAEASDDLGLKRDGYLKASNIYMRIGAQTLAFADKFDLAGTEGKSPRALLLRGPAPLRLLRGPSPGSRFPEGRRGFPPQGLDEVSPIQPDRPRREERSIPRQGQD